MDITYDQSNEQMFSPQVVDDDASYRYAGFWMRFWAFLIDAIVVSSLNGIVLQPIIKGFHLPDKLGILPLTGILTAIVGYVYFFLMTKYFAQTIGKMVLGLKVIRTDGQRLTWSDCFFREVVGKIISKFLYIGYIVAAFTPKKQGIHDLFADTSVIHEEK